MTKRMLGDLNNRFILHVLAICVVLVRWFDGHVDFDTAHTISNCLCFVINLHKFHPSSYDSAVNVVV
jgi:hypothetical protein